MSANKLKYLINDFLMEWDEDSQELGELVLATSVEDLPQHKEVLLEVLTDVMLMAIETYKEDLEIDRDNADNDTVITCAEVIAWVNQL